MSVERDGIKFCTNCTIYAVNADTSGIWDEDDVMAVVDGVDSFGVHLVHDRTDGDNVFSCDSCGIDTYGPVNLFAVLSN